ncbi:MAG: tetratricopeptide repeat protein [Bacteroidetes bacterium]|nr:tetratricopeptide repeat protein [Bacteroidota bacterium]
MREKITTKVSEELKFILIKFFDEHEVEMFIQNLMDDILILTSINSFDRGGESNSFASGSFFTSKIRSIADRIMTFARDKLDDNKYYNFLVEFGKMVITEGELYLASEIFSNILHFSSKNKDFNKIKVQADINLAKIYISQANWKEATFHLNEAREIFQDVHDNKGLSQCDHLSGVLILKKGDLKSAKSIFEKGLSYLEPDKDLLHVGNIEINLGNIFDMEGNHDEAINQYQSCLIKFQDLNDNRRVAEVRNNMGIAYTRKKEYEYALFEFDDCIKLALEGRYLPILGVAYLNKALVYIEINELKLSAFYSNKAMEICYQVNDTLSIADIYKLKGLISKKQFEFQLAEEYLKASLRLNKELHNELNFADTAFELGLLYYELNIVKSYEFYFNTALEYFKSINAQAKIDKIMDFLK